MPALEFSKGHGTGNDFVVVPDPDGTLDLTPQLVTALCDRRFGIGADGVLRVVRTSADPELAGFVMPGGAEWFMDYRNADGTTAEMCGNGVRVFARYLVETGLVGRDHAGGVTDLLIGTRAGPVVAVVTEEAVSVTMAPARVTGDGTARVGGRELPGTAVDTGNPHLVCRLPAVDDLAALDLAAAPVVDPALFPAGVNVELVAPLPGEDERVRMRVYERGVGETWSCGSGACAAATVVLRAAGLAAGVVTVEVPGGRLTVAVSDRDCVLTGPAVLVAQGSFDPGWWAAVGGPAAAAG